MIKELTIEKIKKLLALAEGTSNLNEAAVAFEQAQRLLIKHKLSQAELDQDVKENINIHPTPLYVGERKVSWKRYLAYGIARFNSCTMYTGYLIKDGKDLIGYMVVGRPGDIENAVYFYNSISVQIESLSKKALADGLGTGKTFTNNFKLAATETGLSRLDKTIKEVKQEYQGTQALVLVNNQLTEVDSLVKQNIKLTYKKNYITSRMDEEGIRLGRLAGEKVSLARALETD